MAILTVGSFTTSSLKSSQAYRTVKDDRYAGDGAVKSAVNWIRGNPAVGVDPLYNPSSNANCVYDATTAVGPVTVSCDTAAGSGSGVPPEQGALPPETLLLLGDRHNEAGPYSYSQCNSAWDSFVRFFTGDTPGASESSLRLEKAKRSSGFGVLSCATRNRGNGPVVIKGSAVAAGKVTSAGDGLALSAYNGDGTVRAKYGCEPAMSICAPWQATRSTPGKPWDGTPSDSDPGKADLFKRDSIGNIRSEFLPIGFRADGSLRPGYKLPERTTAYVYDPTYNTSGDATNEIPKYMKPVTQCTDAPAGTTILFLPGWYRDSEVLSRYMSNPSCPDRTFWFAPRANFGTGGARTLLATDSTTGAFYMDFTNTGGRGCGEFTAAVAARWCMGGSAANASQATLNSKPRVVVGWPKGWEPFSTTIVGGGTETSSTVALNLTQANSIEGSLLSYWSNRSGASTIDSTNYATYSPCSVNLFFFTLTCPSFGQRTLRLANLTPKVTGGPVAESGAPNGRIYVTVNYGLQNSANLNTPQVVIDALDANGVAKSCGTYDLTKTGVDFSGSGPLPATSKYTFTADQAKSLADACGAVELIDNLRITFQVSGNPLNTNLPKLFLDGVKVSYNSYNGASFPVGTDNSYGSQQAAKSDCDVSKPGGQLIFGGESHVYVADGSLEVCGGPDPDNPANAMVTGIYGVPAVDPLRPTSVALDAASAGSGSTTLSNPAGAQRIGDPAGANVATISYPGQCVGFIGIGPCDPVDGGAKDVVATMPGYTAPSGYRVRSVQARAEYTAEGPFLGFTANSDGAKLKAGSCVEDARTTNSNLRQWANEGSTSATKLDLYQYGTARNCIPTTTLASGSQIRWKTNVPGGWGVVFGGRCFVVIGTCNYTQQDQLDGLEMDVTIEPTVSTEPRLRPQSGCITAHPNYTGGEGQPDCAVVRADSFSSADNREGSNLRGTWVGRVSVKGTIYAPSSAIEIDDNDIGYPLASRGAILRHLRISGAKERTSYLCNSLGQVDPTGTFACPMFGGSVNTTPNPRSTILTACIQSTARQALDVPCDSAQGDQILTKAGVRFLVPSGSSQANAPVMQWWSDRRTSGGTG